MHRIYGTAVLPCEKHCAITKYFAQAKFGGPGARGWSDTCVHTKEEVHSTPEHITPHHRSSIQVQLTHLMTAAPLLNLQPYNWEWVPMATLALLPGRALLEGEGTGGSE